VVPVAIQISNGFEAVAVEVKDYMMGCGVCTVDAVAIAVSVVPEVSAEFAGAMLGCDLVDYIVAG
jgi:hypothetical protein